MSKSQAYERVHELLEKVGLPGEVFQRYPHELSGGMKQRVVTAMALVQYPKLVVLDEPTSALDVSIQAQITNLLKQLKQELGLSFIFITHDIALASDVCDQLAVIYGGQVVELGSIEEVLANPQHPYTEKLLASLPRLQSDAPPEFIPGQPPDLVEPPGGCRFHPRVPLRVRALLAPGACVLRHRARSLVSLLASGDLETRASGLTPLRCYRYFSLAAVSILDANPHRSRGELCGRR